jgi:hypothetical protein
MNIVELGCFNGRLVRYLPVGFDSYTGFDANWEGGLDDAIEYFDDKRLKFLECNSAEDFKCKTGCNVFVSLETLEHLPEKVLDGYLEALEECLDEDCKLLITVPNEIGLIFAIKYLIKRFVMKTPKRYSFYEYWNQIIGRSNFVKRDEHKGFNWRFLARKLSTKFQIVAIEGVQTKLLPTQLNFSVGIVLKKVKKEII